MKRRPSPQATAIVLALADNRAGWCHGYDLCRSRRHREGAQGDGDADGDLAIYCLATIDITRPPYGLAELTGVAATIAIHWWRRNAVLSILTGTAAYLAMANWIITT